MLPAAVLFAASQAQTPVTVSTSPQNADQVWYSLANGEVERAPLAEWDLAFELSGFTSSIRVNTARGLAVYETPLDTSEWNDVLAADPDNWTPIHNSEETWVVGALNHGNDLDLPEGVNMGWGNYDQATHFIMGTRIYAILFPDNSWKKLLIRSLISNVYTFTVANLDGTDSHTGTLNKQLYPNRNFAYFSLGTNAIMDREPPRTSWDLLFTKYTSFVPTAYGVAGVLQNKGVTALQVNDVPTDEAIWTDAGFSANMNVLGADWKNLNAEFQYEIVGDTTYFVKDVPGNIWKIVFTGYGGGATGDISFNQEMVSSVGISEQGTAQGSVLVYPNPVTDGQAQVMLDLPAANSVARVFNATGQQMLEQQWSGHNGLSIRTLDVHGLAKGIYLLRIDTDRSNTTAKLVID